MTGHHHRCAPLSVPRHGLLTVPPLAIVSADVFWMSGPERCEDACHDGGCHRRGFVFPVQRPREGAQVTKPRGVRVGDVSGPLSATVLTLGGRRTGMGNVGRYVRYVGVTKSPIVDSIGNSHTGTLPCGPRRRARDPATWGLRPRRFRGGENGQSTRGVAIEWRVGAQGGAMTDQTGAEQQGAAGSRTGDVDVADEKRPDVTTDVQSGGATDLDAGGPDAGTAADDAAIRGGEDADAPRSERDRPTSSMTTPTPPTTPRTDGTAALAARFEATTRSAEAPTRTFAGPRRTVRRLTRNARRRPRSSPASTTRRSTT